jgi:hypothetical protein
MKSIYLGSILVLFLIFSTGCGFIETKAAGASASENPAGDMQNSREIVDSKDDEAIKKVISEYFTALYTDAQVDEYNEYSRTGIIPNKIRGFIADKTLAEGDGNPEVGIHLPRYISINGMTIIGYDIIDVPDKGSDENVNVASGFISKNEDNFLYFAKVYAKAKVVPDEVFSKSYRKEEDNTYTKIREVNRDEIDAVKVEIRYDVELTKSGAGFSVLRAIESNIKAGRKNRLFVLNNDNITRLPYLDLEKTAEGTYRNPIDGDVYEAEKAVITEFFQKFTLLDRERMNLLSFRWEQGFTEVKKFLDGIGITTGEGRTRLIEIDVQYNENYPFNSLPLRNNMETIKEINNFAVTPYPAYSEKIKWYFVNFDALVQRTNGITDEYFTYRYDYLVSLSEVENSLIIEKFKLNEYYTVPQK